MMVHKLIHRFCG